VAKIMIISDGVYGERSGNILKEHSKINEFIGFFRIPKPSNFFVDEIELPKEIVEKFSDVDILITYTTHPDNTYEVCRRGREENPNIAIIVAAWKGDGQKKELQKFDIICPYIMCEIDENNLNIEKYPKLKEFLEEFGKQRSKFILRVAKLEMLRF
jgi:hypothetical protein